MFHLRLAAAALTVETQRRREDRPALLARLHGARRETLAVADPLDMVEDRERGVAGEDEVAVHAVRGEVGSDGLLGGGEGLRYGCAAVDAARAGRVPERASVCVDILACRWIVRRGVSGTNYSMVRHHWGLGRGKDKHTGPMSITGVSSRMFSMCDFEESYCGGLNSVTPAAPIAAVD